MCVNLLPRSDSWDARLLPIEDVKKVIMHHLHRLEQEGMVDSKNDYQEIINAIAKVCIVAEREARQIIVMHCRQCLYVFVSNASGMQ